MRQENKIDFTKSPEYLFSKIDADEKARPSQEFIAALMSMEEYLEYDGLVLFMSIIAYMRINATKADNNLHIPADTSLDTLTYNEEEERYFFEELFKRFRIICEANKAVGETANILEYWYMNGVDRIVRLGWVVRSLLELDWSETGFGKRDCSLYVRDELIWWLFVNDFDFHDNYYKDYRVAYYVELHNLAPLVNILPGEKQLCTPILYINYLVNLFEQLGWDTNDCETLVKKYLNNVTAVQVDSGLWAIQTLQLVLFGCDKQLISRADELSLIHNKVGDQFDVILLPEVDSSICIPDVGPITTGNITIEKGSDVYYVAFLYNLLNDTGRMLVRLSNRYSGHSALNTAKSNLLSFFVDNNLIEAMIQTEDCVYMLIDKNRPETKHGKILFYYQSNFECNQKSYPHKDKNLALSIEEYSCEYIKLRHDEGACIVSNNEIRLNDYCLLPKKYIYDFDRVKQQVESDMIQHIRHDANQLIPGIGTSLKTLGLFLNKRGLDNEPSQEKLDEDDIVPSVKELIDGSRTNLLQLQSVFTAAREVVLESFDKSNFNPCDLNKLFAEISNYQGHKKYSIQVKGTVKSSPIIYENAFRDMIRNIISNAENHGFKDDQADYRIVFDLSQKGRRIGIKCLNNGEPLPPNFTKNKLFAKGDKGPNSSGMGLGGERIGKILAAHDAGFDVLPVGRLPKGFTVGFEITLSVERETNEQG